MPIFMKKLCLIIPLILSLLTEAEAVTLVPPGNRNPVQPPVPGASAKRTRELSTSYAAKYTKIYNLLKNDTKLRARIIATAKDYEIGRAHV